MEKKKLQSVSIAALIVSILPLAALAPSLLHLSLSDCLRKQDVAIYLKIQGFSEERKSEK